MTQSIAEAKKYWLMHHVGIEGFSQAYCDYIEGNRGSTNFFTINEEGLKKFTASGGDRLRAEISKKEIEKIMKRQLKGLRKVTWKDDKVHCDFDITKMESIKLKGIRLFKGKGFIINPNRDRVYVVVQ